MTVNVQRTGAGYRHDAFVYRGDDEFLSWTVPFVQAGLDRREPVMVAVMQRRLDLLRAALGSAAASVHFVDMEQLGANPAHIIPCWRTFIEEPGAKRAVGEPIWPDRRPEELAECQFHEALLNVAVDPDTPLWLACPYDAAALKPDVVAEAGRSHPTLIDEDGHHGSTTYGGLYHVQQIFRSRLPEPEKPFQRRVLGRRDALALRAVVLESARWCRVGSSRADDLAAAVLNLAASGLKRGHGQLVVRVWFDERQLTIEISDDGTIDDPLIGRTDPVDDAAGRAVWLANELCDLVQVRSTPDGTVTRVLTWL